MNILLIGAGALGSRHLQGIARMAGLNTAYVVETYAPARERAEQAATQNPALAPKPPAPKP